MRALALLFALMTVGCTTTVPVTAKFPDSPPELKKRCEDLKQVEAGKTAITDLLKTVVENYIFYYECSNRVDGWIDWHTQQKKIFENVNK